MLAGDAFPHHGNIVPGGGNPIGYEDLKVFEALEFLKSVVAGRPGRCGVRRCAGHRRRRSRYDPLVGVGYLGERRPACGSTEEECSWTCIVGGRWQGSSEWIDVVSPYSGEVIDRVPVATATQIEEALATAERGAVVMRGGGGAARADILRRAADLLDADVERIARTISLEVGKPIGEATGEASRFGEMFRLASFEGTQIRGETLPLDAQAGGDGKLGFTLRIPTGVVVAITPFNYPGLLVVHKIAPALAAGNAVILKPASQAPLTALIITEKLIEAGLPGVGLQTITGGGRAVGMALVRDARVRKVSFTGSTAVGEEIARVAGVKRLSLELGANCPMIVMPDADLELAAEASATGGYVNAGQVCISLQRVIVHEDIYEDYLEALRRTGRRLPNG